MIDLAVETLIPLNQIPHRVPSARRGKRIGLATLYRWLDRGLESVKIGGTRYSSTEALARFAQQSPAPTPPQNPLRVRAAPITDSAREARRRLQALVPGLR